MFDEDALVPEFVTFGLEVKLAVQVLVDFLLLSEVDEGSADDADAADPLPFVVESGVLGTAALTEAPMTTGALGEDSLPVTGL